VKQQALPKSLASWLITTLTSVLPIFWQKGQVIVEGSFRSLPQKPKKGYVIFAL